MAIYKIYIKDYTSSYNICDTAVAIVGEGCNGLKTFALTNKYGWTLP